LAGGVAQALAAAQTAKGRVAWIEIEVTNLDELREALAHNPDVVLLDNMSPQLVGQAVKYVHAVNPRRTIRIEASGGITIANIREFAETGVDWISVGALTHSAPSVDLSFEILPI
jgi:nicotinate-nucleotide pyrophosphorylase (carboxylating)